MANVPTAPEPRNSRPRCSRCGAAEASPIVYGFVDAGAFLELGRALPDFELGGLTPRAENWCCRHCGHRWVGAPQAG